MQTDLVLWEKMENWTKDKWQEDELINKTFLQIREGFKKKVKKL